VIQLEATKLLTIQISTAVKLTFLPLIFNFLVQSLKAARRYLRAVTRATVRSDTISGLLARAAPNVPSLHIDHRSFAPTWGNETGAEVGLLANMLVRTGSEDCVIWESLSNRRDAHRQGTLPTSSPKCCDERSGI